MTEDTDWMDAVEPSPVTQLHRELKALDKTPRPKKVKPVATYQPTPGEVARDPLKRPRALIVAERQLSLKQRMFLHEYQASGFVRKDALKAMAARGQECHGMTLKRWFQHPEFVRALELRMEHAQRELGLDQLSVLHRVNAVAERALETIEYFDAQGNKVVEYRDLRGALKALELLGKNKKLWAEDAPGARITIGVELIDWSGNRPAVIEAEATDGSFSEG